MGNFNIHAATEIVQSIRSNQHLSEFQKKLQIAPIRKGAINELKNLESERRELQNQREKLDRLAIALKKSSDWIESDNFVLEKNDCSRLHKLKEKFQDVLFFDRKDGEDILKPELSSVLWERLNSFVVQHDWASAFNGATDFEGGEVRLPYNECAFEFRISGMSIIVLAFQTDELRTAAMAFIEIDDYWYGYQESAREIKPFQFAWNQIRAISIALDAEAAQSEIIRAPHQLNKQRERRGKPLLYDYRIVCLNKKHSRYSGLSHNGTRKRLHFRRGHWRHFEQHKTWIRWCLVGNPDLGFIDKEYRI